MIRSCETKFIEDDSDLGNDLLSKEDLSSLYSWASPSFRTQELYYWSEIDLCNRDPGFASSWTTDGSTLVTNRRTHVPSKQNFPGNAAIWLRANASNWRAGISRWNGLITTDGELYVIEDPTAGCYPVFTCSGYTPTTDTWTHVFTDKKFIHGSASDDNLFLVDDQGAVWGWGCAKCGVFGVFNTNIFYSSPVQIASSGFKKAFVEQSTSGGRVHLIGNNGKLASLGCNFQGQLGINVDGTLCPGSCAFTCIHATCLAEWRTSNTTHALRENGELWFIGSYPGRDVGDGNDYTGTATSSPIQVLGSGYCAIPPSNSSGKKAAIKCDGTLWVWGDNTCDNLGIGTGGLSSYSSPVQVQSSGDGSNWKCIYSSVSSYIGIKKDGSLWGWGYQCRVSGKLSFTYAPLLTGDCSNVNIPRRFDAANSEGHWTHIEFNRNYGAESVVGVKDTGCLYD